MSVGFETLFVSVSGLRPAWSVEDVNLDPVGRASGSRLAGWPAEVRPMCLREHRFPNDRATMMHRATSRVMKRPLRRRLCSPTRFAQPSAVQQNSTEESF